MEQKNRSTFTRKIALAVLSLSMLQGNIQAAASLPKMLSAVIGIKVVEDIGEVMLSPFATAISVAEKAAQMGKYVAGKALSSASGFATNHQTIAAFAAFYGLMANDMYVLKALMNLPGAFSGTGSSFVAEHFKRNKYALGATALVALTYTAWRYGHGAIGTLKLKPNIRDTFLEFPLANWGITGKEHAFELYDGLMSEDPAVVTRRSFLDDYYNGDIMKWTPDQGSITDVLTAKIAEERARLKDLRVYLIHYAPNAHLVLKEAREKARIHGMQRYSSTADKEKKYFEFVHATCKDPSNSKMNTWWEALKEQGIDAFWYTYPYYGVALWTYAETELRLERLDALERLVDNGRMESWWQAYLATKQAAGEQSGIPVYLIGNSRRVVESETTKA